MKNKKSFRMLSIVAALCLFSGIVTVPASGASTETTSAQPLPNCILVSLDQSHSFYDIETYEAMFAGMGFSKIIDVNGQDFMDPNSPPVNYYRNLVLYLEEPGKDNVRSAIERLNKMDCVLVAETNGAMYSQDWVSIEPDYSFINGIFKKLTIKLPVLNVQAISNILNNAVTKIFVQLTD